MSDNLEFLELLDKPISDLQRLFLIKLKELNSKAKHFASLTLAIDTSTLFQSEKDKRELLVTFEKLFHKIKLFCIFSDDLIEKSNLFKSEK